MTNSKVILSHTPGSLYTLPTLSLPISMVKKLRIPYQHPLQLQLTGNSYEVMCQPLPIQSGNLMIDDEFANLLGLPDQCPLQISYSPTSNKLKLGPVLAILVSHISSTQPPCEKLNPFCKELILLARSRHIFAYVTSIEHLLNEADKVVGWTFSKNSWIENKFPCPTIVHNRIGSRKVENSKEFQQLKGLLEKKQIRLFNRTFLDKWEVYEKLSQDKKFIRFLPLTQPFSLQSLKAWLSQYPVVFVKPIHGSLGQGIYRISRHGNSFDTQYTTKSGQIYKNFTSFSKLYSYLSKRVSPKKHIVQEGIPLVQSQGRTLDFRALMQKNKSGHWSITSMVARMGPENRFVSNVARGGELMKVQNALLACGFSERKKIRNRLIYVAKKACEGIERSYQDQFGELGVDLGIDRLGHIYLLEINSKPSKTDDSLLPSSGSKGRPSVRRLLDYTQYLSNHSTK